MLKPCANRKCRAGLEIRQDLLLVERGLRAVGHEERDELGALDRVGGGANGEAGLLGGGPRRATFAQPELDLDARLVQVERVCVTLAAVAQDGDLAEQRDVAGFVDLCHRSGSSLDD